MTPIPPERLELFNKVIKHGKVTCLFAIDQPLVTHLCEIINIQAKNLDEMDDQIEKLDADFCEYKQRWPDVLNGAEQ